MFKLRLQIFIVMLIMCSLLATGLYAFIKHSFKQDFWHYIEQKETRFAQPLINSLVENFHHNKNWNWIQDWDSYVLSQLEIDNRDRMHNRPIPANSPLIYNQNHEQGPPQNDHRDEKLNHDSPEAHAFREWRELRHMPPMGALRSIFLLDQKHQIIAGKNSHIADAFLIQLYDNNEVIGYLGIPFNPVIRDLQDADFAQVQENKLAIVALIAFIISGIASFPLAHLLTKRINRLVSLVSRFSEGNYRGKISIKGHDELSTLAEHLNHLGEVLTQSEKTRRQWVADISHELRTPIAVLQAELEAMEDGVRPLDTIAIHRLMKHNHRLKHLVNDLYELSLTDLGGMTYCKSPMNLAALLQDSIASMLPQFQAQGIKLLSAITQNPINISGDYNRLQQLFANLLKNSLHYTNAPGETRVAISTDSNIAKITIEDSAPGVAPEHHEKLFDRLYRADSSRNRETGGAGLGLSICKNIVAAHEGTIAISNSELGGLKITISLPYLQVLV